MRVGFIKQLLWERYGSVWQTLFQGIDVDILESDLQSVVYKAEQATSDIPGLQFRLAVAEASGFHDADLLVVPDLNYGETIARGSGQDPWIANFPETLQRTAGLPTVLTVPATLDIPLESFVLETMMSLKRDSTQVRRVWERTLPSLKPKRYPDVRWTPLPGQKETTGLIGQPWLLTQQLTRLLISSERHTVSQAQFSPAVLRDEAKRLEQRFVATDAEVLGATHFFNRKGTIDKLVMVVDTSSGSDVWLEKQVKKIVTKPLEIIHLQDVISEHGLAALFIPN